MSTRPHFKFNLSNFHVSNFCHVEVDGVCIHQISDVNDFYAVFGYTKELADSGVTGEEFIWAEYTKAGQEYPQCFQINIIKYLNRYSEVFKQKYGALYQSWIATHELEMAAVGGLCAACKAKRFCGDEINRIRLT